jgi:hypothetical protein
MTLLNAGSFPPWTRMASTLSRKDAEIHSATASSSPSWVKANDAASMVLTLVGDDCFRDRNSLGREMSESSASLGIRGSTALSRDVA